MDRRTGQRFGARVAHAFTAALGRTAEDERRRARRALRRLTPVRLDYDGAEIRLYPTPYGPVLSPRARAVAKEPWTAHWLAGSLREGDVFWDVGANVGSYSLLAARVHSPDLTVVSVEPAAASFDALVRNIAENELAEAIIPLCLALVETGGVVPFAYRSLLAGEGASAVGTRAVDREVDSEGDDDLKRFVPSLALSLDTLVSTLGLPPPTHLKLDLEGGELSALRGSRATMASHPPETVMVEADSEAALPTLAKPLVDAGLRLALSFRKSERTSAVDAFFARDAEGLRAQLAGIPDRSASRAPAFGGSALPGGHEGEHRAEGA